MGRRVPARPWAARLWAGAWAGTAPAPRSTPLSTPAAAPACARPPVARPRRLAWHPAALRPRHRVRPQRRCAGRRDLAQTDARAPCAASRHAHTQASPPVSSPSCPACLSAPSGAAMGSRSYRWAGRRSRPLRRVTARALSGVATPPLPSYPVCLPPARRSYGLAQLSMGWRRGTQCWARGRVHARRPPGIGVVLPASHPPSRADR